MITFNNSVVNAGETPAIAADVWANVPLNNQVPIGFLYLATDTLILYRNDGTAWQPVSGGGGAAGIDTVLAINPTAISKTQYFEDGAGNLNLQLNENGINLNDFVLGKLLQLLTDGVLITDTASDFFAYLYSAPGVESYLILSTDKYRISVEPAIQSIQFLDRTVSKFCRLTFPNTPTADRTINIPDEDGTIQLKQIYGGQIDLILTNYTLLQPNQYLDVIATGVGNIICDNMATWPDGSTVNICVSSAGFTFNYVGTFKGNQTINKEGLYILQVVAGVVYCSDPA